MMMRNFKLSADLPSQVVDALEAPGGVAMIIPIQENKINNLGLSLLGGVEAVELIRRSLVTLQQVLESDGDREEHIRRALEKMLPTATAAVEVLDDVKRTVGSAVFVRNGEDRGRVQ